MNDPRGTSARMKIAEALDGYDMNTLAARPRPVPPSALDGMSPEEQFFAAAGAGLTDLVYGPGRVLGLVSAEDWRRKREIDAPLQNSPVGSLGYDAGLMLPLIPAAGLFGLGRIGSRGWLDEASRLLTRGSR